MARVSFAGRRIAWETETDQGRSPCLPTGRLDEPASRRARLSLADRNSYPALTAIFLGFAAAASKVMEDAVQLLLYVRKLSPRVKKSVVPEHVRPSSLRVRSPILRTRS